MFPNTSKWASKTVNLGHLSSISGSGTATYYWYDKYDKGVPISDFRGRSPDTFDVSFRCLKCQKELKLKVKQKFYWILDQYSFKPEEWEPLKRRLAEESQIEAEKRGGCRIVALLVLALWLLGFLIGGVANNGIFLLVFFLLSLMVPVVTVKLKKPTPASEGELYRAIMNWKGEFVIGYNKDLNELIDRDLDVDVVRVEITGEAPGPKKGNHYLWNRVTNKYEKWCDPYGILDSKYASRQYMTLPL